MSKLIKRILVSMEKKRGCVPKNKLASFLKKITPMYTVHIVLTRDNVPAKYIRSLRDILKKSSNVERFGIYWEDFPEIRKFIYAYRDLNSEWLIQERL